jgi:hypothetical protein
MSIRLTASHNTPESSPQPFYSSSFSIFDGVPAETGPHKATPVQVYSSTKRRPEFS